MINISELGLNQCRVLHKGFCWSCCSLLFAADGFNDDPDS